jgi:hypothetical protein
MQTAARLPGSWLTVLIILLSLVMAHAQSQPAIEVSQNQEIAELEKQREKLLVELARERERMLGEDPVLRAAVEPHPDTGFDGYAARAATNWLIKNTQNDPQAVARADELFAVRALARILDEPHGEAFVKSFVTGDTENAKRSMQNYHIADGLALVLPDVKRDELNDPAHLWQTIRTKLPSERQRIEERISKLTKEGGWPDAVTTARSADIEEGVRTVVYNAYEESHLSPAALELRRQVFAINQRIDAMTAAATQPTRE